MCLLSSSFDKLRTSVEESAPADTVRRETYFRYGRVAHPTSTAILFPIYTAEAELSLLRSRLA